MKIKTPQLVAAAQETMTPLVKQMFNGAWPDKATIEQLNL